MQNEYIQNDSNPYKGGNSTYGSTYDSVDEL